MLIHYGVTPYMVFDGDYLPSKAATEIDRENKREESKRIGLDMYRSGKVAEAHKELQKAVDVTPIMARELIEELKLMDVRYVVAPYEADAQLAYLEQKGIISAVLSEDSDLLVFGTKCLLTKLDQYGDCVEINRQDFTACRDINLAGWSNAEFRRMAILSGCDYVRGIPKMGLRKAHRLVRKYKDVDKIIRMMQFDGQFCVPAGYQEAFKRAELTFLHQRVFCPLENRLKMFSDFEGKEPESFDYIGQDIDKAIAIGVAHGDLHPTTKKPITVRKASSALPRTPFGVRTGGNENMDHKKGQSIESFFKAKRTPLAELDPNCFTPSPTQLRLQQEQSNVTWQSSPAPASFDSTRSTHSLPEISASNGPRTHSLKNALLSRTATVMSQKRRRLCDDVSDTLNLSPTSKTRTTKSKFFQSPAISDSPTGGPGRRRRKQRAGAMNIWSDDSIEDAMADLPDMDSGTNVKSDKKIPVFLEKDGQAGCLNQWAEESLEQPATQDLNHLTEDSQSSVSSLASNSTGTSTTTVATSTAEENVSSMLDASIKEDLVALSRTLMYEPRKSGEHVDNNNRLASRCEIRNNQSRTDKARAGPLVASQCGADRVVAADLKATPAEYHKALQSGNRPCLAHSHSLTPLGRLGVHALNRARSFSGLASVHRKDRLGTAAIAPSSAPAPGSRSCSMLDSGSQSKEYQKVEPVKADIQPDGEHHDINYAILESAPDVLRSEDPVFSAAAELKEDALEVKGSEDLMIPDSEGSDAASIGEVEASRKPTIDLGRFAFSGA